MSLSSLLPQVQDAIGQATGQWFLDQAIIFLMIAARIGGLVVALPSLTGGLPVRLRVLLVVTMSLVLVPSVSTNHPFSAASLAVPEIMFAAMREVVFGMIIGGVVQLLVTGIGLAGELIANITGMQLAQSADPSSGEPVPQLSKLLGLLVTTILFTLGGHRLLVDALLESFDKFPPMTVELDGPVAALVFDHLAIGIESGLRVAAPVLGCVLLTNVIVALISRTVPQLNVLAIGLNINVMAALIVMALTVGSAGLVFETELADAIARLGLNE